MMGLQKVSRVPQTLANAKRETMKHDREGERNKEEKRVA